MPVEWGGLGGSLEDLFHVIATLAAEESNVAHALRIHFDLTEQLVLSPRSTFNDTQIKRVLEGAIFGGASATARVHNFDRHWRNLRTIFSHNPLLHKARVIGDYEINGVTTHLTEGRVF